MVDIADLQAVQGALNERNSIEQAIHTAHADGVRITQFILKAGSSVSVVSAEGITYPPQMLTAIQEALDEQLEANGEKLKELGVTGLKEPESR